MRKISCQISFYDLMHLSSPIFDFINIDLNYNPSMDNSFKMVLVMLLICSGIWGIEIVSRPSSLWNGSQGYCLFYVGQSCQLQQIDLILQENYAQRRFQLGHHLSHHLRKQDIIVQIQKNNAGRLQTKIMRINWKPQWIRTQKHFRKIADKLLQLGVIPITI